MLMEGKIEIGDVTVARPSFFGPYLISRVIEADRSEYLGNDANRDVALQKACKFAQNSQVWVFDDESDSFRAHCCANDSDQE